LGLKYSAEYTGDTQYLYFLNELCQHNSPMKSQHSVEP